MTQANSPPLPLARQHPNDHKSSDTKSGTLGKAMDVLELVVESEKPLRFTDILALSDQPRGTLHRQLSNLVTEGLLHLDDHQTYAPGLRLLKFAAKAWSGNTFRMIAEPHLRKLSEQTGETVHLGVLRGHEVIYLDKVEGRQNVRMHSQIGNASPCYCTGVGKAALAHLPQTALDQLLQELDFRAFTPKTLTGAEALRAELAQIRQTGRAYDREEHENGICCLAAPIYSHDKRLLAGVSVTGPSYRIDENKLQQWAPHVASAAAAIMADMQTRLGPRAYSLS